MRAMAAAARSRERDPASPVGEWGWFGGDLQLVVENQVLKGDVTP
jgi:hypothetical protein